MTTVRAGYGAHLLWLRSCAQAPGSLMLATPIGGQELFFTEIVLI